MFSPIGPITRVFIWINILIYLLLNILSMEMSDIMFRLIALFPISNEEFKIWQPITYIFTQLNFFHILLNMLGLFYFGTFVESQLSRTKFIIFYLISGIIAGIGFQLFQGGSQGPLIGASGSICALIAYTGWKIPKQEVYWFGLIKMTMKGLAIFMICFDFLFLVLPNTTAVAHMAHILGSTSGIGYYYLNKYLYKNKSHGN